MELKVECQTRPAGSKPRALRREGRIPANLYGHKGAEAVSLTVDAKAAELLLKAGAVNSTLIQLNVPDLRWRGKTLLREVQKHPAKGYVYHLSFFSVAGQESVEVEVPLNFVGEPVGVKPEGGVLDLVLNQLQVECAPENIPEAIDIDISQLHLKDSLLVNQLVLPEGVTVLGEPERVVVNILPSTTGAEAEAIAAEDETDAATAAAQETMAEVDYGGADSEAETDESESEAT